MKVVVPIAGRGSRFKKEAHRNSSYAGPKPFIDVKGKPMVSWATGSLPFIKHSQNKESSDYWVTDQDLIFISLEEHESEYHVTETLKQIYGPQVTVILLPEVTRGAAETVLQAKTYINNDESLIITDSDHFFDGQAVYKALTDNPDIDGLIPVFYATDPKWSFSRLNAEGYVDLVAEKQPVSEWANIGAYYYKRGKDFVTAVEEMIAENELTNGEFYVAPVYNKLISKGAKIKLAFPEYVYGLGTPADLEFFLENTNFEL